MNNNTKKICFTGVFAAIIFLLTMLHVPIGQGGYIHVGDAAIYIVALLSGSPWAFLASVIGAAAADAVSSFYVYILPTAIIKVLIAVPFVLVRKKTDKLLNVKTVLCSILGGCITVGGYFIADLIIYRVGAVADIPANIIQAVGSAVVFIILAFAFDRAKIKQKYLRFIEK